MKCDEIRPICLNCQRQGETCDYSIRLNWEGRGKNKSAESASLGQVSVLSGMISGEMIRPGSENSGHAPTASEIDFQDMSFSKKQEDSVPETGPKLQPDLSFADQPSQQLQETSQVSSSRPASYEMSMIDPALTSSLGSSTVMYNDSIYGGIQGRPEPQYAQSYVRYHSATPSTHIPSHPSAASGPLQVGAIKDSNTSTEPGTRNLANNFLPMKSTAILKGDSPVSAHSSFENVRDNSDVSQPDIVEFDRPPKRARYPISDDTNSLSYDAPMPTPNMTSYPVYSVDSEVSGAILFVSNSVGPPVTPASSHGDDTLKDADKAYTNQLSPHAAHASPDIRRLSVHSLLSGPPGTSYQADQTYDDENQDLQDWSQQPQNEFDDATIYGIDRGFKDLDIGKNDDMNAISGSSPHTVIEHHNHIMEEGNELIPMEFGFGTKENAAFENGAYYDKPVHVSIPRALEPLPSKLLENPMNLLVCVKCFISAYNS